MNDYAHMQWIKLKFKLEHVCEEVFNDWVNTDKKSRPAHKKHSKE